MKFKFVNYGGTDQLRLETADDIHGIELLEETFWMATSAPIEQLTSDPKFLALLDQDGDKRILSKDIRREYSWLKSRLANWEGVSANSDVLQLAHLDSQAPEGQKLAGVARLVLKCLGKEDAVALSLADVRNHLQVRLKDPNNGDGVIMPVHLQDEALKAFAQDILATTGGTDDLAGAKGVSGANLDAFIKCSQDLLAWQNRAETTSEERPNLFPLGGETAECYNLFTGIRDKMDHFFELCRFEKLNESMGVTCRPVDAGSGLVLDKAKLEEYIAQAPLAKPNAEMVLRLDADLNPAYRESLEKLNRELFAPLLGDTNDPKEQVTADDWLLIAWLFGPYEEWLGAKSGGEVEILGPAKLQDYLNSDLPGRLRVLIEEDLKIGKELAVAGDLEHLILLQRWLLELCRNFVNFHNLYDPDCRALFEEGRVVLSGHAFNLNIRVKDVEKHAALAKASGIFLVYSEVTGSKPEEKFNILTPVTNLSKGKLEPERRGVLFDRENREWDVRIVKVIENPVTLMDELCKPFRRIAKFVGESFEKLGGSAEKQLSGVVADRVGGFEKGVATTLKQAPPGTAPAPPASAAAPAKGGSNAREWFFSASVAVAALSSSFAFVSKTIAGLEEKGEVLLRTSIFVLAIIAIGLALIAIPVIVVAIRRLRARNLAALLHASGWAVNAEMRMKRRLAKTFAPKPVHPAGFGRLTKDVTSKFSRRATAIQSFALDSIVNSSNKDAEVKD